MNETEDEVTRMEMCALLEPVTVSGQHVLLVSQKLTATVVQILSQVLLVSDDATVRTIVVAAAQVLECLSQLGCSLDTMTLLKSFQEFSDALILLKGLTVERARSLQDPRQAQSLLDSLGTLSKCISMLHTAMLATIKHPSNEQAQAAKAYILDKVESSVKDIVDTLHSRCDPGSYGPCGFYTGRRNSLMKLLDTFSIHLFRSNGLDSMVRDIVFHCMLVANPSPYTDRLIQVSHFVSAMAFDAKSMENVESSCLSLTRLRSWI
uniref:Uncharacterized protein n=1 Tax=Gadus morhua TaxID=8049 RepID=A0A8C5C6P9_GADMO